MSTRLLSAIRAAAEVPGVGSADAGGFSWHAWYRANRLSVTAHEDSKGTHVQILLDRSAPMVQTLLWVVILTSLWMLAGVEDIKSYPDLLVFFAIPIGMLAAARAYWKSSTRSLRERITLLLDAVQESPPTGGAGGS